MKTPVRLLADIQRRLDNTWQDTATGSAEGWPLRLPLGKPTSTDLSTRFPAVQQWAIDWRTWAETHVLPLDWENRLVHGTRQALPTHLTIPDIDTATALLGGAWPDRLARGRARWQTLCDRFPSAATPAHIRYTDHLTEVDFGLLCDAATWFASHDAAGLTPRQVSIEGLHGKWLNRHHAILTTLSGKTDLGLVARPTRVHFTYLDPEHRAAHHRRHDSITLGDTMAPPYQPTIAVITENKDTAVYFPPLSGASPSRATGMPRPRCCRRSHGWSRCHCSSIGVT